MTTDVSPEDATTFKISPLPPYSPPLDTDNKSYHKIPKILKTHHCETTESQ